MIILEYIEVFMKYSVCFILLCLVMSCSFDSGVEIIYLNVNKDQESCVNSDKLYDEYIDKLVNNLLDVKISTDIILNLRIVNSDFNSRLDYYLNCIHLTHGASDYIPDQRYRDKVIFRRDFLYRIKSIISVFNTKINNSKKDDRVNSFKMMTKIISSEVDVYKSNLKYTFKTKDSTQEQANTGEIQGQAPSEESK